MGLSSRAREVWARVVGVGGGWSGMSLEVWPGEFRDVGQARAVWGRVVA